MATPIEAGKAMETQPELVRGLGIWAATAIVVGTMIGTGIFLKPAEMAAEGGSIFVVFAAWIAGGLLSLFGAMSYAELGAAIPEAGGEYAYLRRAFGPVWGFLFGWMHSIVGRPASAAAIAAGLLRFWAFLMPAVAAPLFVVHLHVPHFAGLDSQFAFTWAQPLAVLALALMTGINYLGVKFGGEVQVALTMVKVAALGAIIALGFALGHWNGANFQPFWPAAPGRGTLVGFLGALAASLFVYDGWQDLNLVGSEVRDPAHNIPRALVGGVLCSTTLLIIFNVVCFYVLPFGAVASSPHVASDVAERFGGHGAALWFTLAMVISALGTLNSSILSGARVDYAMARDGIFFRVAAGVHPKFHTPANALTFQWGLASIMALTGTFEDLTSLFVFATWIFYGFAVAALFQLRRTEPNLPRPYRAWGYPVLPVIFLAGAAALTLSLWAARPLRSTAGLLLIVSGLIFYRHWQKKTGKAT